MRTLLIDNYDSYTYNLFQLLAEVTGVEPAVILNDQCRLDDLDPAAYDCAVISPGPGHPQNARDFGICRDLLCRWSLPVLGVCLGHQGMAHLAGGLVAPAPAPRHGHLSRIRHDGRELFAGLPQGFAGVRYHSLCVHEPLPAVLQATAWAEDGVVMGLRHLERPWWGVQFHPESIATEHGRRLVESFRRIVVARSRPRLVLAPSPKRPPPPSARSARPARPPDRPSLHLRSRVLEREVDPEAAFAELFAESPYAFWLDSSLVVPGLSRFSFMGDASGPLAEVLTHRVGTGHVQLTTADGRVHGLPGDIFEVLARRLGERRLIGPAPPCDLPGGYVGYFGYELKAGWGSPNRHRSETPDAVWLFADRLLAFDHLAGRTHMLALDTGAPGAAASSREWLAATARRIGRIAGPTRRPPPAADDRDPSPHLARTRERYLADVAECQRRLRAGETYEVCLTNKLRLPASPPPLDFHRRLRRLNPAPYAAFLRLGELAISSSSPERFLRVDRQGQVQSRPIKGTAARHPDPARDRALGRRLARSPKERAENLMIVDLVRNDLGRVCRAGSVGVSRFGALETYATVHQLVSAVEGRLAGGVGALEAVRACFPGGSMTGAPKLRTMEIIDRLESEARGVYSGALGYLGLNGAADLSIVIRTAVFWNGEVTIGGGGAVVLDSDPGREWEEMLVKVRAPLRALDPAGG